MLHYGLLVLLALTIVASLKAVGIILVVAMLVAPGAIAYLLTDRFERMLVIAAAVAIGSSALGTILELPYRRRHRACIVLVQATMFVLHCCSRPSGARRRWPTAPVARRRRAGDARAMSRGPEPMALSTAPADLPAGAALG